MKISKKEVEHVAHLARLNLSEEEITTFTDQLNSILAYMEKLEALDTKGIELTSHAVPLSTAFREDEVKESLPPEKALQNAPDDDGSFFIVPKVIE